MRVVTIVSLAASAALGVGALVVANYVLPNSAAAKNPLAQAQPQGAPLVVASRAIKYGEKLQPTMLTVIKVPKDAIPVGAYTSVAAVMATDNGGAPVALTPMSQREPVLPTKLSGPGSRPIVSAEIAEGMRAYSLKVNDASGPMEIQGKILYGQPTIGSALSFDSIDPNHLLRIRKIVSAAG